VGYIIAGSKCNILGVLWREGGLLLSMATIMVGVLLVRIPMAAHIDMCTAEGVLLEIIHCPNYQWLTAQTPSPCFPTMPTRLTANAL